MKRNGFSLQIGFKHSNHEKYLSCYMREKELKNDACNTRY